MCCLGCRVRRHTSISSRPALAAPTITGDIVLGVEGPDMLRVRSHTGRRRSRIAASAQPRPARRYYECGCPCKRSLEAPGSPHTRQPVDMVMTDYFRRITHRLDLVSETKTVAVALDETTTIVKDEDGDPLVTKTHLVLTGPCVTTKGEGEDVSDALFQLEKTLDRTSYLRICHQCRFGCTHPFQGEQWWCLAHVPAVADGIQRDGKACAQPLTDVQVVEVGPTNTCARFERPCESGGGTGTPERR